MKIQVDGIMYQYVLRVTAAAFYGAARFPELENADKKTKEFALVASLEFAVVIGGSTHRFDAAKAIDIFEATPRLIRHWSWLFPGDRLNEYDPEHKVFMLSGRRSRYIKGDWAKPDRFDPAPKLPD